MPVFNWTNDYSVDTPLMDDHHKQLFNLMNKLTDVMDKGTAQTTIGSLLDELIKYSEYHFGEEERLMEQARYPGLYSQRVEHQAFLNKLREFRSKVANNPDGAIFVAAEASMVASDWLKFHIRKMDKGYAGSLRPVDIN